MQKDSLQNRNGIVKTIAKWDDDESMVEEEASVVEEEDFVVEEPVEESDSVEEPIEGGVKPRRGRPPVK